MRNIYVICFLLSVVAVHAQNPFAGNWVGKLQAGAPLRLVLHVKDSAGIHVTMDSPDQNAFGFKADGVSIQGDSITILFNRIRGKYKALLQIQNDKQQVVGTWSQGGMKLPLTMERGDAPVLVRPQTPKPPFTYQSEEILYTNTDKTVTLGGTLTIPNGEGKYPVLILITGSGPQDRDETIFGHKPFWVIADHLSRNGFAVLRVDDRGIGKSVGSTTDATSEDYADDVITSINYLKTRKEINAKKIGLLGHSEGGMIAPIVATKTKDVAFMVFLAGPAVTGIEVLSAQRAALYRVNGVDEATLNELNTAAMKATQLIVESKSKDEALVKIEESLTQWALSASPSAKAIMNMTSDAKAAANEIVNQLYSPWFKYFLKYDPAPVLQKSKCPVLAVYGSKDVQVVASQNLEPMKSILTKSRKAKDFNVVEMPGLNHMFQKCTACTVAEYGELTQTFSEETLALITDWLKQTTQ